MNLVDKIKEVACDREIHAKVIFGGSCFLLIFSGVIGKSEDLEIQLKQSIVNIQVGDDFQPMDYVVRVLGKDAILYLPETVDTTKEGSYVLVYRLETEDVEIRKNLILNVMSE